MANVSFKRGTAANLAKLSTYTDGCFYLTSDTNRLYVAQSASNLVELNKSIEIVANVAALPKTNVADGQFYYAQEENILCVYKSTEDPKWIQINPDTNTTYKLEINGDTHQLQLTDSKDQVNTVTFNADNTWLAAASTNDTISYSHKTNHTNSSTTYGPAANATLGFGGTFTVPKVVVDKAGHVTTTSDTITYTLPGTPDNDNTTYRLESAAGSTSLLLHGTNEKNTTIDFSVGNNGALTIDGANENEIVYSHTEYHTADKSATTGAQTPASGGKFKIPQITVNKTGHIIAVNEVEVTLPEDKNTTYSAASITANNQGKLSFTIHPTDGTEDSMATSTSAVLYHKVTVDGTENTVNNQNSLGSFYSASRVDELIENAKKVMNSMTYKGTVASQDLLLAIENPQIGDTYLASADIGSKAKLGDLLIWNGSEAADATNALTYWDVVPSGDEVDTTYTFNNSTLTLSVAEDNTQTATFKGAIKDSHDVWQYPETKIESTSLELTATNNTLGIEMVWGSF